MSMPKGLAKATNYYNRIEAINDWNKLATQVSNAGMSDLAAKFRPAEDAGWRKIDKAIAALREAFQERVQRIGGTEPQPCPIHGREYNGMCGLCVAANR